MLQNYFYVSNPARFKDYPYSSVGDRSVFYPYSSVGNTFEDTGSNRTSIVSFTGTLVVRAVPKYMSPWFPKY